MVERNEKYGIIDTNGNIVIPIELDLERSGKTPVIYDFCDGLAMLKYSSSGASLNMTRYSYLDSSGNMIIDLDSCYDAKSFSENVQSWNCYG